MELFSITVNQILFAMTLFHDLLVKNLFTQVTNLICCKDEDYQGKKNIRNIFEDWFEVSSRLSWTLQKKSCTLIKDGLQELNSQIFPWQFVKLEQAIK